MRITHVLLDKYELYSYYQIMSSTHIVIQISLEEPTMSQDLMPLRHPNAVSALREISLDRLAFTQRCIQDD